MKLNKKIEDITPLDIVKTGIYSDVDFKKQKTLIKKGVPGSQKKLQEIVDRGNRLLKNYFIEQELIGIKEHTKDYFEDSIGNLSIVASRIRDPKSKDINKNNHWVFRGYITFLELGDFSSAYSKFKNKYEKYNRDDWQLNLDVIGGIIKDRMLITADDFINWAEKGVLIEPWGFGEDNKLLCFSRILMTSNKNFNKEVNSIREKGKINNLNELRMLLLAEGGKNLLSQLFNK